eukprot:10446-Heterococcus_DN1.PRE.1
MLGEAVTIGTGLLGLWWSWTGTPITEKAINNSNNNAKPSPMPAVLHSTDAAATAATVAVHKVYLMLHISALCCSYMYVINVTHAAAESTAAVDTNAASATRTERASIIAKTAVVLQSAIFAAQTAQLTATTSDNTTATTTETSATLVTLFSMAGTAATGATNNGSKDVSSSETAASKRSSSGCEQ